LVAELAMFEDLVGDEAAEVAGARDEDLLEPDASTPPPLEDLPHQLSSRVGQDDVQDQEDCPHELGDLECAGLARDATGYIDLDVRCGQNAEDHRENAADEDREEVVHARSTAPQPVQAL